MRDGVEAFHTQRCDVPATGPETLLARIHSLESMGTLDGPGLRYVVFFQGCAYRCRYCHNPDTWDPSGGRAATLEDLLAEVRRVGPFLRPKGGVTASGGEPLLQAPFVRRFFQVLQREGFHTALDTAGMAASPEARSVLDHTDLVLLDLKGMTEDLHRQVTGRSGTAARQFLQELHARQLPVWFRVVLVPGLTDDADHLRRVADTVAAYPGEKRLELLPFHQMGRYKWEALKRSYPLDQVREPDEADLARARSLLGLT